MYRFGTLPIVFQAETGSGAGAAGAAAVTPPETPTAPVLPVAETNVLGQAPEKPAVPENETPEAKTARETAEAAAKVESDKAEALKNETPEAKAAREAAEAEAAKAATKPEPIKAEQIKLPDGFTVNEPLMAEFVETANKLGINAEGAQELANLYAKQASEIAIAPYKEWVETQKGWIDEIKADTEIGGKNFDLMQSTFANALEVVSKGDKAFEKDVRDAFISTGAGNNPKIVKFVHRLAQSVTEGGFVGGRPTGSGGKSAAEKMYGGAAV